MEHHLALELCKFTRGVLRINTPKVETSDIVISNLNFIELLNPLLTQTATVDHPPHGSIILVREGNIIRATLDLFFEPQLECIRCLESFRLPLQVHSEAMFVPRSLSQKGRRDHSLHGVTRQEEPEEVELTADDLDTYYHNNRELIMDEFVHDALALALPDLPLCHDGCRGLCCTCGQNLNQLPPEAQRCVCGEEVVWRCVDL